MAIAWGRVRHVTNKSCGRQLSAAELGELASKGRWKLKDHSEDMACLNFISAIPEKVTELDTPTLATAFWVLAAAPNSLGSLAASNYVGVLCQEAAGRLGEMAPGQVVNISWALGFMHQNHQNASAFLGKVASCLELRDLGAGQLVALAWAFARARPEDRDVQVGQFSARVFGKGQIWSHGHPNMDVLGSFGVFPDLDSCKMAAKQNEQNHIKSDFSPAISKLLVFPPHYPTTIFFCIMQG